MWIWIIGIAVVIVAAAIIGSKMPSPGLGRVPDYPGIIAPPMPPIRLNEDGSDEIRRWAIWILNNGKQLSDWEMKFLTKISKTRLNLTEAQGDKVHELYEEYLG